MKNKQSAVYETLHDDLTPESAKKFFYNVYEFLLYNDTEGFLATLEYRMSLNAEEKSEEDYFVFRYMLQYLVLQHSKKIAMLHPEYNHLPLSESVISASSSFLAANSRSSALSRTA